MRRSLMLLIAIGLVCGLTGGANAHIGEKIFLLFEATADDLADIDLRDGSVEDWEDVFGEPSWVPTDLFADPTVGDGAQYDPADLDYRIWAGWNSDTNTIWYAMDRIDNVYFGREYDGSSPGITRPSRLCSTAITPVATSPARPTRAGQRKSRN